MSPAVNLTQRANEEWEISMGSNGSLISLMNHDTWDTSRCGNVTNAWQLTVPCSSAQFVNYESSIGTQVGMKGGVNIGRKVGMRGGMSFSMQPGMNAKTPGFNPQKMAQEFCFGELEKNFGFKLLWDIYCATRNRPEYTKRFAKCNAAGEADWSGETNSLSD